MTLKDAPQGRYNTVLRLLAAEFRQSGFGRRGATFRRRVKDGWQILNFQKSRKSSQTVVLFTVNIGVCIERLREFFGHEGQPSIEDVHWRSRIGPEEGEEWWTVGQSTSVDELATEMTNMFQTSVMPLMEEMSSAASLARYWLSGKSEGLTDAQRLMNLVVLLSESGRTTEFTAVREELVAESEGRPWAAAARAVLSRLPD
jgi:hypothetical protein